MEDVRRLGGGLISARSADVGAARERARGRRLRVLAVVLGVPLGLLWYRILDGRPFDVFALPPAPQDPLLVLLPLVIIAALGAVVLMPLASGRSPHVRFRPEQLDVTFADVQGIDGVVDEVVRTLNTFLGYALYRDQLGGTPRRGLLFEGPPGTGKTHLAKAMAREAGVPFLYVSSTSFQSMWYGATARKIRSYFRALRRAARREGGAIAGSRGGVSTSSPLPSVGLPVSAACTAPLRASSATALGTAPPAGTEVSRMGTSEGTGGVVNELLVQLQSFDTPPPLERAYNAVAGALNAFLPAHRQLRERAAGYANVLVIAATNRADTLDPALLRPGRFDRRLPFELPAQQARRALLDHFLGRKAHAPELDSDAARDAIAGQTFGYTPVMIEHLLDESLVLALKDGREELSLADVAEARMVAQVGLKNPVVYTAHEREVVATHEAGHATVAQLSGSRRLEVLSIVKRAGSLGLLSHGDLEEVWTRSKEESYALVDIALGGMVAEELWFSEAGTGPTSDLAAATEGACQIVGASGMAGSLVSLAAVATTAFADMNLVGRVLADPVGRPAVDNLLAESKARVRALLHANRHIVEALRDALVARDELVGAQITEVIEAAGPPVRDFAPDLRAGADTAPADRRGALRRDPPPADQT